MNRLREFTENLIYELNEHKNDIDAYIKTRFNMVEGNSIQNSKLRNAISELVDNDIINGIWADDIFMKIILLENFENYISEFPKLTSLSRDVVLDILECARAKYDISNVLIYSIDSCGTSQIGWEQIDEYEWRIKIESFESINVRKCHNYISSEFAKFGYVNTKNRDEFDNPRKRITSSFKHKSLIEAKKQVEETDTYEEFTALLVKACLTAQAFKETKKMDENGLNTYIRDQLVHSQKFRVLDQTLRGESSNGKSYGELDLFIQLSNGMPVTVVEALYLDYLKSDYLKMHINKLFGYDTAGLQTNYILVYSRANDFLNFCEKYLSYIKTEDFLYNLTDVDYILNYNYSELRMISSNYNRNGNVRELKHLIINMK